MPSTDPYEHLSAGLGFKGSDRLRAVLEDLLTPEQARVVASLPGSPADVAAGTALPEDRVRNTLDDLALDGVVHPKGGIGNSDYFYFKRGIVQLLDATTGTKKRDLEKDRHLFEHWQDFCVNEMYQAIGNEWARRDRPPTRIVPAYAAIKDLDGVPPQENFHELLKAQDRFAVIPCPCRQRYAGAGDPCDYVVEAERWQCILFGREADAVIRRGAGSEISLDEVLTVADRAEEDGLLHTWTNGPEMTAGNSCQCCRDCCVVATPMDAIGASLDKVWARSSFEAQVDQVKCDGCQDCVERCQFEAISMVRPAPRNGASKPSKKLKAQVDPELCWGCGVCVLACDEADALGLRQVRSIDALTA